MRFFSVGVEGRRRLGDYTVLEYRWPHPIEPGQFVMARPSAFPLVLDPLLARPLSFYDHDGEVASLLFEVRGRGTALLERASEVFEVSAPLGRPFRIHKEASPAALLGGGVGIAPMKILSRFLSASGVPHDVFLGFAGATSAEAAREFSNARLATMDGSAGVRGTVLDVVRESEPLAHYPAVYACGPNPMLAAVRLAAGSGPIRQLSVEERMGCGNGSCNGCVVPLAGRGYVRSCVEGPVFDAEALAW